MTKNFDIQRTAGTICSLADANIPYSKDILSLYEQSEGPALQIGRGLDDIVVARYLANHNNLEKYARLDLQVIELGAGFAPHGLHISRDVSTYIEIDHVENSELKRTICDTLNPNHNINFVGGDLLDISTWERVAENLDAAKPVYIFNEGVVSQYFTDEQKSKLVSYIKPLMQQPGSCFVTEDSFKHHPYLQNHPRIIEAMGDIAQKSQSQHYGVKNSTTLTNEKLLWSTRFDPDRSNIDHLVGLVPYPRLESELDFALEKLRLIQVKKI